MDEEYNAGLCKKTHEVNDREISDIKSELIKGLESLGKKFDGEIDKVCLRIAALEGDFIDHKEQDTEYKRTLERGVISIQTKVIIGLCGLVITLVLTLFVGIMTGMVKII